MRITQPNIHLSAWEGDEDLGRLLHKHKREIALGRLDATRRIAAEIADWMSYYVRSGDLTSEEFTKLAGNLLYWRLQAGANRTEMHGEARVVLAAAVKAEGAEWAQEVLTALDPPATPPKPRRPRHWAPQRDARPSVAESTPTPATLAGIDPWVRPATPYDRERAEVSNRAIIVPDSPRLTGPDEH